MKVNGTIGCRTNRTIRTIFNFVFAGHGAKALKDRTTAPIT
jgi:hypothetical protein